MSNELQSIAASLSTIAAATSALQDYLDRATTNQPVKRTESTTSGADDESKPAAKKVASKKTASKKVASKKAAKTDDLSDIVTFKKKLFEVAEASGLPDVLKKARAFIAGAGYESSDEIEVEDREQFLADIKGHFTELAEAETASDNDDDDYGL